MNDMKISNGNPYLHAVEFQGSGQNVEQAGGTGAGTSEKSNLTFVQGAPSEPVKQTPGVNKHVLDLPRPTEESDLNALSCFLAGWKSSEDLNEPVNKNALLKEKRAQNTEKQENVQTDLVVHKVMSEAAKVNHKATSTSAQINLQANNAQWRVAEESAEKTAKARNKDMQWLQMGFKVLSTALSISGGFVKNAGDTDKAGNIRSVEEIKKLNKVAEKTRDGLDIASKVADLAAAGVNIFAVSKEADEQVVESHKKQAIQSFVREGGALAKSLAQAINDLGDKTQDIIDAIVAADIDAIKKMPVTAN